ncbi:MAG TPA: hypothetical protein VJQ52_21595 [Steroidobacteraceae bacterium]|nr:hypothetical protein [Steroidobacteraceae bacterium]
MISIKPAHVMTMLGLLAPLCSQAADYCIATNGGFGKGGSSFIGKNFVMPTAGLCVPWSGFTKTASSVIAISAGTACRSTDGKALELSISSTDPAFLGSGVIGSDHIRFCPAGAATCPFGGGSGTGTFSNGGASRQTCTTALLKLPAIHD